MYNHQRIKEQNAGFLTFASLVIHGEEDIEDMKSTETANFGNIIETECPWYCLSNILRNDSDLSRHHWNAHRIRESQFQTINGSSYVFIKFQAKVEVNLMFDQASASFTEEEYPENHQEYFSSLREVIQRQKHDT